MPGTDRNGLHECLKKRVALRYFSDAFSIFQFCNKCMQHILFLRMVALFNGCANGFSQATFRSNYKMKLPGVLAVVTSRTACLRCIPLNYDLFTSAWGTTMSGKSSKVIVCYSYIYKPSLGCRITIGLHPCHWGTTTHTLSPLKMAPGPAAAVCQSRCANSLEKKSCPMTMRQSSRSLSPKTWKSGTWEQIGDGRITPGPSEVSKMSTSLNSLRCKRCESTISE